MLIEHDTLSHIKAPSGPVHKGLWAGVLGKIIAMAGWLWEYMALPIVRSVKNRFALHRIFKLRQRYLLTRNNRFRLRYVLSAYMAVFLTLGLTISHPDSTFGLRPVPDQEPGVRIISMPGDEIAGNTQDQPASQENAGVTGSIQGHISEGMRRAAAAIKKAERPKALEVQIGRGDTLTGVLEHAGVSAREAYQAVKALSEHFDPRHIKPGQVINVKFGPGEQEDVFSLASVNMKISPVKEVDIRREDDVFVSSVTEKELINRTYAYEAAIETSLYGSAARAGIPPQIIAEVIRVYSWDVDFQRDIRRGDKVEVMYETKETEDGDFASYGDVIYANLSVGGQDIPIYRYEMKDGRVDYFQPNGQSIRKTLMKTPIDGARISSGFGMRKHPVLGYNKMHKGMDFAAPTGTPIYAAGDGTLDYVGRKGGYGNYMRIRHNSTLKTAYAHLHRFAKGMSKGKRVEQGQVIGYVGTTGRSTGPHLHYEVLVNNSQVNPNNVDLPTGEQLEGLEMKKFKALMAALNQQYVSLTESLKFAQNLSESARGKDVH